MQDFVDLLNAHDVAYLLVGGYAVNVYGYTRATLDIDFLIRPSTENAEKLAKAIHDFGFGNAGLPLGDFAHEGLAVHLGVEPNRIDLLTSIGGIGIEEAFAHAAEVEIDGRQVKIIALQTLIRSKSKSTRAKDLADAEELRAIHQK